MGFSVVIPTYEDYDGVYFTTQSLFVHHSRWVSEIVVVDNHPNKRIENYCRSTRIKYIPMPDPVGPANSKDRAVREATGDKIVCVDSHCLLHPGFFDSLDSAMTGDDLYHGPLIYDWGDLCADHMTDKWSGQMWGTWGNSWTKDGMDPWAIWDGVPIDLKTQKPIYIPRLALDMRPQGYTRPEVPFEIPAHGCGMFAVRKGAWLGFNPQFRGFGGEEWYLQTKYRQAGRRAICVPGAKWTHRFNDLSDRKLEYPLTREAKIRNYCIGLGELGIPLDRLKEHFGKQEVEMACGCSKRVTPAPDGAFVPTNPATDPLVECDTVFLGAAPHAIGRWSSVAKKIIVEGIPAQAAPLIKKYPEWFIVSENPLVLSRKPEDKKELPPLTSQALSLFKAMGRAALPMLKGRATCDEATHERRMEKCFTCPYRVPGDNGDRCSKCGCFLAAKTWVASESCPDGRWGVVV